MKLILGVVLAALACLALAASAYGATTKTKAAAVGFEGQNARVAVLGTLRSSTDRCLSARKVALVAERGDEDDKLLGTDSTSRNGGFSFDARVPDDATNLLVAVKGKRISKQLKCGRTAAEVAPAA